MEPLGWAAAAIAASVTVVAGVVYLFGRTRTLFRIIEKAAALLESELTNNSGTSMKDGIEAAADDLHGIAVAIGRLQRGMDDAADRIEVLEEERATRRRRDVKGDTPAPSHREDRQ